MKEQLIIEIKEKIEFYEGLLSKTISKEKSEIIEKIISELEIAIKVINEL